MDKKESLEQVYKAFYNANIVERKQDFAELLGISRTALSKAMNGDTMYLTDSLIKKVLSLYEEHFGSSCIGDNALPIQRGELRVIPDGARGGTIGDFANSVKEYDCEHIISPIKGADYAIQVTGDSMSPEYPNGCKVIIKKVDEEAFIEWGKVYVLDTPNGAIIKQVRKTDNPDVVECVSLNPAYQTFTVNTKYIQGWYRILMSLCLK